MVFVCFIDISIFKSKIRNVVTKIKSTASSTIIAKKNGVRVFYVCLIDLSLFYRQCVHVQVGPTACVNSTELKPAANSSKIAKKNQFQSSASQTTFIDR